MTKLVDYLIARAFVIAFRGGNYRPYIALARLAAWIGERKGARWLH